MCRWEIGYGEVQENLSSESEMNKAELIERVTTDLQKLGLTLQRNAGTDLSMEAELLDAQWTTGRRTIRYEAAIFFDEGRRTVVMHERTAEKGGGFSFGFQGESSVQVGRTLRRKVTIVSYGPEGKAIEFSFDIGAIVETVRSAAQQAGWSFQSVLRKSSAMWPKGYIPASDPTTEAAPVSRPPSSARSTKASNWPSIMGRVGLALWSLLVLLILIGYEASWGGWMACVLILGGGFVLQTRFRRSGCLIQLLLGVATVVVTLVVLAMVAPPSAE